MAKSNSDRNTIDLFGKTRGRPRTHPLNRKDQLKQNKRQQRAKDKAEGKKRLELVLDQATIEKLDALCESNNMKRHEWLGELIEHTYSQQAGKKSSI